MKRPTFARDAIVMPENPRDWLGRGLEPVPGKPFGWAHNMEAQAIREHLMRRPERWSGPMGRGRLNFRIAAIQLRLRRNAPTFKERHARWLALQPVAPAPVSFTRAELLHLVELFDGANDPMSIVISAKAQAMLGEG